MIHIEVCSNLVNRKPVSFSILQYVIFPPKHYDSPYSNTLINAQMQRAKSSHKTPYIRLTLKDHDIKFVMDTSKVKSLHLQFVIFQFEITLRSVNEKIDTYKRTNTT